MSYFGETDSDNIPHGRGICIDVDGEIICIGNWVRGNHGPGKYLSVYDGESLEVGEFV